MPRPKTKQELIDLSRANFEKLFALIATFDEKERVHGVIPFEDRDKNIRDILVHLHHWHLMFQEWYRVGMTGDKPDIPAKGYTFKTLPALNMAIWEQYQDTSYDEAVKMLEGSFADVQKLIHAHTEEELFEKKRYKWTGTTSLGSYMISATSSHYDWAMKKIRKYKRALSAKA